MEAFKERIDIANSVIVACHAKGYLAIRRGFECSGRLNKYSAAGTDVRSWPVGGTSPATALADLYELAIRQVLDRSGHADDCFVAMANYRFWPIV